MGAKNVFHYWDCFLSTVKIHFNKNKISELGKWSNVNDKGDSFQEGEGFERIRNLSFLVGSGL